MLSNKKAASESRRPFRDMGETDGVEPSVQNTFIKIHFAT